MCDTTNTSVKLPHNLTDSQNAVTCVVRIDKLSKKEENQYRIPPNIHINKSDQHKSQPTVQKSPKKSLKKTEHGQNMDLNSHRFAPVPLSTFGHTTSRPVTPVVPSSRPQRLSIQLKRPRPMLQVCKFSKPVPVLHPTPSNVVPKNSTGNHSTNSVNKGREVMLWPNAVRKGWEQYSPNKQPTQERRRTYSSESKAVWNEQWPSKAGKYFEIKEEFPHVSSTEITAFEIVEGAQPISVDYKCIPRPLPRISPLKVEHFQHNSSARPIITNSDKRSIVPFISSNQISNVTSISKTAYPSLPTNELVKQNERRVIHLQQPIIINQRKSVVRSLKSITNERNSLGKSDTNRQSVLGNSTVLHRSDTNENLISNRNINDQTLCGGVSSPETGAGLKLENQSEDTRAFLEFLQSVHEESMRSTNVSGVQNNQRIPSTDSDTSHGDGSEINTYHNNHFPRYEKSTLVTSSQTSDSVSVIVARKCTSDVHIMAANNARIFCSTVQSSSCSTSTMTTSLSFAERDLETGNSGTSSPFVQPPRDTTPPLTTKLTSDDNKLEINLALPLSEVKELPMVTELKSDDSDLELSAPPCSAVQPSGGTNFPMLTNSSPDNHHDSGGPNNPTEAPSHIIMPLEKRLKFGDQNLDEKESATSCSSVTPSSGTKQQMEDLELSNSTKQEVKESSNSDKSFQLPIKEQNLESHEGSRKLDSPKKKSKKANEKGVVTSSSKKRRKNSSEGDKSHKKKRKSSNENKSSDDVAGLQRKETVEVIVETKVIDAKKKQGESTSDKGGASSGIEEKPGEGDDVEGPSCSEKMQTDSLESTNTKSVTDTLLSTPANTIMINETATGQNSHSSGGFMCNYCRKTLDNATDYRHHINTHSANPKFFSCSRCGRCFTAMSALKSHKATSHAGEKKHKCYTCGKEFLQTKSYKNHLEKHEVMRLYTCKICKEDFECSDLLKRHMTVHKKPAPALRCAICQEMFYAKHTLNAHLKTHKVSLDGVVFNVAPSRQTEMTPFQKYYFEVRKSVRKVAPPYRCKLCKRKFDWKHSFMRHIVHHTRKDEYLNEFAPHKNSKNSEKSCSSTATSSQSLPCSKAVNNTDSTLHSTNSQLDESSKSFIRNESDNSASDASQYKCEVCGEVFSRKSVWIIHNKAQNCQFLHDMQKVRSLQAETSKLSLIKYYTALSCAIEGKSPPFTCTLCSREFKMRPGYMSHMKMHARRNMFVDISDKSSGEEEKAGVNFMEDTATTLDQTAHASTDNLQGCSVTIPSLGGSKISDQWHEDSGENNAEEHESDEESDHPDEDSESDEWIDDNDDDESDSEDDTPPRKRGGKSRILSNRKCKIDSKIKVAKLDEDITDADEERDEKNLFESFIDNNTELHGKGRVAEEYRKAKVRWKGKFVEKIVRPKLNKTRSKRRRVLVEKKDETEKYIKFLPQDADLFPCSTCISVYSEKIFLKLHIKQMHKNVENKNTEKKWPFMCTKCNHAFKSQASLQGHETLHKSSCYECRICHRVVIHEKNALRHVEAHFKPSQRTVL